MLSLPGGLEHFPGYLDREAQTELVAEVRAVVRQAPLYTPTMPHTGKSMSVRMTNCGPLGWVTDKIGGYRYQRHHPETGEEWPPIPARLLRLWEDIAPQALPPEACLINFYEPSAKMGLHQDRDEQTFDAPVVSISLGDSCLFRIGGTSREDPTVSMKLHSGDVVVMGGDARLAFHGVDRIYPNTSTLLKSAGRINLTLRRVTAIRQ